MEDIARETEGLVPPDLNLVTSKGSGGHGGQDKTGEKIKEVEEWEVREAKSSEEQKGGLINHLISTLPSSLRLPLSPKSRQANHEEEEEEEEEEETSETHQVKDEEAVLESTTASGDGGGGIISNLISNFLNPSEGGGEEEQKRDEQVVQSEAATEAKEVEKEEGGGLIDNLVSHFCVSLSDDAAPAADEAAILIHSIIHD